MDSKQILRQKELINSVRGQDWEILIDASLDQPFIDTLKLQEVNMLKNIQDNPSQLNNYFDYYSDILAKYHAWTSYNKSANKEVKSLKREIVEMSDSLDAIRKTARYIGGATVLTKYAVDFKTTSTTHSLEADKWKKRYYLSILATVLIICSVFFLNISDLNIIKPFLAEDITGSKTKYFFVGVFILKSFALFSVYQVSVFFKRSYSTEKHLQEVYQHRSDVLQSLHAVYESIDSKDERDRILSAAAIIAYDRGETGYITTREGAGSDGDMMGGILSRIMNTKI